MASAKLLLFTALVALMAAHSSAGVLDKFALLKNRNQAPTTEGYRTVSEEPNKSKQEEMNVIMNPSTPDEQLVVMGKYSSYDEKSDTDTESMYTGDKDGYKPRYQMKNRKLNSRLLASLSG